MSFLDKSYHDEFKNSLNLLQTIAEAHENNEELLIKINQIKRFENVNGEYDYSKNPLLPFPTNPFEFLLKKTNDFKNNKEKLERFIDETLKEQANLNIHKATETYVIPFNRSVDALYNFLSIVNHYINNVPSSEITNYSSEVKHIKKQVDILEKEIVPLIYQLKEKLSFAESEINRRPK